MKDVNNIYYAARIAASKRDRLFANRDRAAEQLHISGEALYDYERGITIPPCDVVQWMVDIYGEPDLKRLHIRSCCPLMTDYGGENSSELARAALGWAVAFQSAQEIALRFAAVARDGEITADELPAAMAIRAKAVELRRVMEETMDAIDKATLTIRMRET